MKNVLNLIILPLIRQLVLVVQIYHTYGILKQVNVKYVYNQNQIQKEMKQMEEKY